VANSEEKIAVSPAQLIFKQNFTYMFAKKLPSLQDHTSSANTVPKFRILQLQNEKFFEGLYTHGSLARGATPLTPTSSTAYGRAREPV
jgi:hypothetical protein